MPNHSSASAEPSVIHSLREATRALHESVGASPAMSRLFGGDYTLAEYRAHLGRLFGFFEPLENAASRAAEVERSAPVVKRSDDLLEDLHIMGASAEETGALERCTRLPPITRGGLRGYLYVVLGSTLGAQVIVKQLRGVLGPKASFRFYGDEDGRHKAAWALFRPDLEENGKDDVEAICATAVAIFSAYAAWFSAPPLPAGDR